MKKFNYSIIAVLLVIISGCGMQKIGKGNYAFQNMSYYDAAKFYEESLKDKENNKLYAKIGFCYFKMNRTDVAAEWYVKAIDAGEFQPEDILNLAISQKTNGNFEDAKLTFDKYLALKPDDMIAKNLKESCDSVYAYHKDSSHWKVTKMDFGTGESQFSPTYYDNGIVFCSPGEDDPASSWDGKPYLDLYHVKFDNNGRFSDKHLLGNSINSIFHEGPAEFSKGYHEVFFTRANFMNGKPQKNNNDESVLRIFTAKFEGDDWINVDAAPFSPIEYNTAHPALNLTEDYLYFVSDMPGGYGGFDIYRIKRTDNSWGVPENLGAEINTQGNELFPTINYDHVAEKEYLYYSTDAKHGLGGLDIYRTEITGNKMGISEHLNYPVNSKGDDFGLLLINNPDSGYVSSSRDNTSGTDYIYKFSKKSYKYYLKGIVKNKKDLTLIPDAHIVVLELNDGQKKFELQTDAKGEFVIEISKDAEFMLEGKKDKFFKNHTTANSIGLANSDTVEVELMLEPIILNLAIRLDNIYYDYNKWDIRSDAAVELDKLVKIMLENPEINIELSSHTDARGNDKYNMDLSQKRAQSAVDYIISKGIAPGRIYAKGYGESVILNRCKNKVKCDDSEHQLNRRTEFKVVKISE